MNTSFTPSTSSVLSTARLQSDQFSGSRLNDANIESSVADTSFRSILQRSKTTSPPPGTPEGARAAAEEFVAVSLVQPILAALRSQSQAAPPFAAGEAEKAFGPLWDAEMASRISKAQGFDVVDVVARNLLKKSGALASSEPFRRGN